MPAAEALAARPADCTSKEQARLHNSFILARYVEHRRREQNMLIQRAAELAGMEFTDKDKSGKLDHNRAMIGDDLVEFVRDKLFPYLHGFKQKASSPDTLEYKIGEIFGEIKKINSAPTCARSSTTLTSCASARRGKRTSFRTCTKPRYGTWATPGAMATSITRRARSSGQSCRW